MVQALDKSTTSSAHKGVLQSTEQNSVELLDIVLIGSLTESKRTTDFVQKYLVVWCH